MRVQKVLQLAFVSCMSLIAICGTWLLSVPAAADDSYGRRPKLEQCASLGVGAGPMIGGSFGKGILRGQHLFVGWEASAGCPTLRGGIGGMYALRSTDGPEAIYYVAYEPGYIFGATVGAGYSTRAGATPLVGGWTGMAWPVIDEISQEGWYGTITAVAFTFALGVRVRWNKDGIRKDLYFTPKLQYIKHPDFFT